jgi:hypothetical protein
VGPQSRSGRFGGERNFAPARIRSTFVQSMAKSLCRLRYADSFSLAKVGYLFGGNIFIFLIPNDCERQKGTSLSHKTGWQSGNALGLCYWGSRFETLVGTMDLKPEVFVIFVRPYRQILGLYLDVVIHGYALRTL